MAVYAVWAWSGCLLFLVLHAATILLDPTRCDVLNYPFLIAAPLLGIAGVYRLARRAPPRVRLAWLLLAAGLVVWDFGTLTAARSDLVGQSPFIANLADVFYISYGVAIMAALALPDRRALVRSLVWTDVAQALLAILLCYIAVFSVIPFSSASAKAASAAQMARVYMVENLALLAVATLRLLGRPRSAPHAPFDRTAFLFLGLYAVCIGIYNANALHVAFLPGLSSLLIDLPFLSLLLIRVDDRSAPADEILPHRRTLALLVDGATPSLYTLALLYLSFFIAQNRLWLGSVAMIASLMLMVVRSALLESYHLQAQDALTLTRDRLLRLSLQDDLTGIANRRAFQAALAERWAVLGGDDALPLSLLLLDIDHFKAINDRLGHEAGDTCLVMVANALRDSLREPGDLLFRYGGEEFAVLLTSTRPERARLTAEALRLAVHRLAIPNRTSIGDRVTISIGVATTNGGHRGPSALIAAADRVLYEAKAAGRNRVLADHELGQEDPLKQGAGGD